MKQTLFTTTLLVLWTLFLSGCMTTWPIVDDLNHYKKWDTYENIKEENKEVIEDEQENFNESAQEEIIEDEQEEFTVGEEENLENEWQNLEEISK